MSAESRISGHTRLLGVFGFPVSHSLSPRMHNALLQHHGLDAVYVPLAVHPQNLAGAIAGFRAMGFLGANATIPFKEMLLEHLDELSPLSRFTGSVNTLYWNNGKLCGTTTDPYGALRNLVENGVDTAGKHIALLGNGGAARALAFALMSEPQIPHCGRPASLTLVGRDEYKLETLAAQLSTATIDRATGSGSPTMLDHLTFEQYQARSDSFDLVVNTTPVGMTPDVNKSPLSAECLHSHQVIYDIVYNPRITKLLADATAKGCRTVGGLGMLIYQGALSFTHWFPGIEPDVSVMKAALEEVPWAGASK